jgi:hypothetical protein
MHRLHTVAFVIDRLAEGNPFAWTLFLGLLIVLGIAFAFDVRRNRRRAASGEDEGPPRGWPTG